MKVYKVNIKKSYGLFSLFSEPLRVKAFSATEAIKIAEEYLRRWNCINEYPVNAELLS